MAIRLRLQPSKFSRRIFVLFVITAIIPITLVATLSYRHVADQLRAQSYEKSRQDSKAVGMELFSRLNQAKDRFESVARSLYRFSDSNAEAIATNLSRLLPDFNDFIFIKSGHVISGDTALVSQLPMEDVGLGQFMVDGKTRIIITSGVESMPQVFMVTRLDKDNLRAGMLIGKINQSLLWSVTDLLQDGTELVVLAGDGVVLYTNEIGHTTIRDSLRDHINKQVSGSYLVGTKTDGYAHLVSFWSLFTSGEFGIPDWIIAVSQPETLALMALEDFQRIFLPMLLLVLLIISLTAAMQIRRRVLPLHALIAVTEKVASGDFNERVQVSGDDEIAQLGNSFNAMAERLDHLFCSLETLAEIDRVILASLDARHIVSTALEHAFRLSDCTSSAIITFEDPDSGVCQFTVRLADSDAEILISEQMNPAEIVELLSCHELVLRVADEDFPAYIPEVVHHNCDTLLLIPMLIESHLAAVMLFGYSERQVLSDETRNLLHKFTDRIDVALSNARWEGRLYQQAHYDTLTGLPNRTLMMNRLEQSLTRSHKDNSCTAILFIGIDRFKVINDSLGHSAGDRLLRLIAMTLASNLRDIDTAARFGGDEFVVIIPDLKNDDHTLAFLQTYVARLLMVLHEDVDINGINLTPEASVGIAVYPQDGADAETLIKNADAAMHFAKEQGRNQYSFYSPEFNRETLQRLKLEQELRKAIDNGELRLFYQPKLSVDGRTLLGAEALVRWQHPERGLLMPSQFISLAEETGLIDDLGVWVKRAACLQIRGWLNRGLDPGKIAINLPSGHFCDSEIVDNIFRTLQECGLDGSALEIEITETAVMSNDVAVKETMQRIKDAGISIAIDDFGTGYSSLSYLHKLPIDKIKIDQSFVMDMIDNQDSRAIVASTIALAHDLGFKVVAEGVENAQVQEMLAQLSCDELQGYYFSEPLPVADFEQFMGRFIDVHAAAQISEQNSNRPLPG